MLTDFILFQASHPVVDLSAFPKDKKLWVEWTPPPKPAKKYIIEWCVLSDNSPCVPDWQQEGGTVTQTYLRGILPDHLSRSRLSDS